MHLFCVLNPKKINNLEKFFIKKNRNLNKKLCIYIAKGRRLRFNCRYQIKFGKFRKSQPSPKIITLNWKSLSKTKVVCIYS